ncbi:MAG: M20/M25/M40 family metallo-hydrolase, partial [Halanaerobiales bacterium]|nr:M20/M25/M40 family metallo-hydrolase [Halanaerobiales bacterium]
TDYQLGTTVNVGLVSGGTATNVVAEHAEAKVDLRITDMEELQRVEATIRKLVEQPKTPGVKVHVTGGVQRPPMNAGDATEKLCALVEEIGKRVNVAVKWAKTGGGSDGNFSAALGIPTIDGLGPIGGGSHSVDEYLVIESIEPRFKLLTELIKRI